MPFNDDHGALRVTRRAFLGSGVATVAAAPALGLAGAAGGHESGADAGFGAAGTDFLLAARSAARWIRSAEQRTSQGSYWLPEPDHPERKTTVSAPNALYSGSSGAVLFFLQLARATGDASYLADARAGAEYLAATWRDTASTASDAVFSAKGLNYSLYGGLAGVAFVLNEVGKATGDAKYRDAAREATEQIVRASMPAGNGIAWSGAPGIAGDGSTILYLLYAAAEFHNSAYLASAGRAGDRLLELGQLEPRGGLSWRAFPAFPGLPEGAYFPNFEGGTAGVAYVLARLYAATKYPKYLVAARQGALHLQSIATVRGNAALIPYRFPDLTDVYYLGFCHGPAGTARTFYELHRVTREPKYQQWANRLAQGVIASGVPEQQTPGFWNVACQCCGSAAVIDLFVGLWAGSGRLDHLVFAQRVARQLVSRGTNLDAKGLRWYQAWTRVKPWEISAETGYSIGAAGVGAALLHVHLAGLNRYEAIHLPDNPFPSVRCS